MMNPKTGKQKEMVCNCESYDLDEYYSCKSKTQYYTDRQATLAAYMISEWCQREYEPYKCRWCKYYHVGRCKERRKKFD